ncbi:MAG TPA: glycosyltransferase, partial [Acidimicrobiales bacterium]
MAGPVAGDNAVVPLSYVLPLRVDAPDAELVAYVTRLAELVDEVIVVDGSAAEVFAAHHRSLPSTVCHVGVDPDLHTPNGKVGGVLTGLRRAAHDKVVVADDDVRWRAGQLAVVERLLDRYEVVRPQNAFSPLPWHARWDTGRMLVNRAMGGDWPGTLGVQRSVLLAAGGYAGDVMFENLELVRTVQAAGGREHVALDVIVERRPPSTRQFFDQRVRQAYDELARPRRLVAQLALLPLVAVGGRRAAAVAAGSAVAVAAVGRRRAGGRHAFPASAPLWAPLWVAERGLT